MPLPARSRAQAAKIDAYVKRLDAEQNEYQKTIYAKWLIMLSAGFVEKTLQEILSDYAEKRGNKQMSAFVARQVTKYLSINMDKMMDVLQGFSGDWPEQLRAASTPRQIAAVNSVKSLRDLFAHGSDNGVSWGTASGYWKEVKSLMEVVNVVVDP